MLPDEQSKIFLQYNYAEMKSLCTQFLTVVTAVLVFSLAFSEKIVEFQKATTLTRSLLISAWCLFFFAIILGGLALYYVALTGGQALANRPELYTATQTTAMKRAICGGGCFAAGLMALMLSAIFMAFK